MLDKHIRIIELYRICFTHWTSDVADWTLGVEDWTLGVEDRFYNMYDFSLYVAPKRYHRRNDFLLIDFNVF